jgi:hypothetical protein
MDDRLRQVRTRLRAAARGKAPTGIRYPATLRREVVGLIQEAQAAGQGVGRLAKTLGLPRQTLLRWGQPAPGPLLRSVRVGSAPAMASPMPMPAGLVLITPQGWRVEGLDVDTLLRVLRGRG